MCWGCVSGYAFGITFVQCGLRFQRAWQSYFATAVKAKREAKPKLRLRHALVCVVKKPRGKQRVVNGWRLNVTGAGVLGAQ